MFWKYNLITTSNIETLLDKEDVTLREVMDQEDILQECKAQSKKLIDFLIRPESMEEMITLITQEPDEQIDEKVRYKYSNISCELLTFDVATINDALCENEALLNKLYNFLDTENSLNPLLASFFSKTMAKVFSLKTQVIFAYLKSKPDFITLLLKHIETSAIMDLLIKLITYSDNLEMRMNVLNWLGEHSIVQRLVNLINPAFSEECHCNAAQALCDMIKSSREHMSLFQEKAEEDPLLKAVESPDLVGDLLNHMFKGEKKESVIVSGIAVLLALLEFKKHGSMNSQILPNQNQSSLQADNAPQIFSTFFFHSDGPEQMTSLDAERLATGVNNVLDAVFPQISDFHNLYHSPPTKPPMMLTVGCLDPPLGYTRLELTRFIVALISTNTHRVNNKLASLKTIHVMMDLFFQYSWNNFLHTQVEHAISRILTNTPTDDDDSGNKVHPLLDQLFTSYVITEKIIEMFKECEKEESEKRAMDKGYMGHLTKIANHIAQNIESGVNKERIKKKLKEVNPDHEEEWKKFTLNTLMEINKKNATPLVAGITLGMMGDEPSYRDLPFSQDSAFQQAQQISGNIVTQICYSNEWLENDDNGILGQTDRARFPTREAFERVCSNRTSSINDDVWADGSFRDRNYFEGDSDSEDEPHSPVMSNDSVTVSNTEEMKMEIDNQDGRAANFDGVPMEIVLTHNQNPWNSQQSTTSNNSEDWADFSAFNSSNASSEGVGSDVPMEPFDFNVALPADGKPGPLEVSSLSDSATVLTPAIPLIDKSFSTDISSEVSTKAPSEEPKAPLSIPPAMGDSISSKDASESKVLAFNETIAPIVESTKDCALSQDTENAVQNGPI